MTSTPLDRIAYTGQLKPVLDRAFTAYNIERALNISIIQVGYEDCNVLIKTAQGDYVAKIFSKNRTPEQIARYVAIMEKAMQAGVNHPSLSLTRQHSILYTDAQSAVALVLMKWIQGKTFLELDRAPDHQELQAVLAQAAKINRIDFNPPYLFDTWAIPNIESMYERTKQFIRSDDARMVEQVIAKYQAIPVAELPSCFVHGDFTKANVLKGDDGNIYILDFSVSGWYPRIQELAVIAANLMHDNSNQLLREKCDLIADDYSKWNPLHALERKHLYPYALAGIAMEFMGAHQEKFIKGNTAYETDYWLHLGREGLRKELS